MGLLQGSPAHSGRRGGPAPERKQVFAYQEIGVFAAMRPSVPAPAALCMRPLPPTFPIQTISGLPHGSAVRSTIPFSYGQHLADSYRRAATYVDRIFNGAKPSELPVELSTRLELIVNLKTAKALGLTVPDTVLARADEVIE